MPELLDDAGDWNDLTLGNSAALVFERAKARAEMMNHTYLGTEHLLIGILEESSGQSAALFLSFGVDRETLKQTLIREIEGV